MSSQKQKQVAHLSNQLQELEKRLDTFSELMTVTVEQSDAIRNLGVLQASWFMAASKAYAPTPEEEGMVVLPQGGNGKRY
ncbi:hypothetical protein BT69DRAFT_1357948 [Atractiella rhizophila]|nr:hypothetical protein BT69DRAFT_1357948 [Atractiella rhizophila]